MMKLHQPAGGTQPPTITVTMPPQDASFVGDSAAGQLVTDLATAVQHEIAEAGGRPVGVSLDEPAALGDGLVLVGGGDVDPRSYSSASPHPTNYAMNRQQDAFEIDMVRSALAAGIPVLGVCRGMQILNVALGGTLTQHLEDADGHHRGPSLADLFVQHDVDIASGTRLATLIGSPWIPVASGHHQAVNHVGHSLMVAATAPDGIVEAIEHTGQWAIGVQWHPEQTLSDPADKSALFGGFLAAVREQAQHPVARVMSTSRSEYAQDRAMGPVRSSMGSADARA